jgi:hypothetical protein
MQCPLVLLGKLGWREFKGLEIEDDKEMEMRGRKYSRRVFESENK